MQQQHEVLARMYQAIFAASSEAIMMIDSHFRINKVNVSFSKITGYDERDVIGEIPVILKSANMEVMFYQEILTQLHEKLAWAGEVWSRRKNGELYPQWLSITAVSDDKNNMNNYLAMFSDLSERKRTEAQIKYLTDYDFLTGLGNRFLLSQQLDDELPTIVRKNQLVAALFLNIDHFKTIVNSLGHSVGDKLLIEVSKILPKSIPRGSFIARLGGDEFAILFMGLEDDRDCAVQTVSQYALRIRDNLSQPIQIMQHSIVITCSMGVAFFPTDADSSEQLFKLADAALHQAKLEGGNQTQFITPEIAQNAHRRMVLLSALNFALALGEFSILFQPQYNGSYQLVSAEALLRWEAGGQTIAYPDEFISLAEENGAIVAIGTWVARSVCQNIKSWLDQGIMDKKQSIAINISPKQFVQPDFVQVITEIVTEAGIEPCNLELELTEGLLIKNVDESISKLVALKVLGFRISIDDFGTGYSSLAYLKRFPLDTLKIDRSFVTAVDSDPSNAGLVEAIIAMAKALKFGTVAEGVETQAEFDFLQHHDCEIYQGFFFSKPLSFNDFDQLLRSKAEDLKTNTV